MKTIYYLAVFPVLIYFNLVPVEANVDLGIQIKTGAPCSPGAISMPNPCKCCVCALFNIQFCTRLCITLPPSPPSTRRPGPSMRPTAGSTGQITLYPIQRPPAITSQYG